MTQQPYLAFTTSSNGQLNVLKNQCQVSRAWAPSGGEPQPPVVPFDAIWDTGATNSVITQAVVDACGLVPTGMADVRHAGGVGRAPTYLVNILLPNRVGYQGVRVSLGKFSGGDILIGMDIIGTGDFAVTNVNGATKFSFRHPSTEEIDFVKDSRVPQFQHGGAKSPKRAKQQTGGQKGRKKKRSR
jgi:hypothetical protein